LNEQTPEGTERKLFNTQPQLLLKADVFWLALDVTKRNVIRAVY